MLLSGKLIRKLGLLDEQFFLYYEDTEYSLRARQKGVPIWYCAKALIYHKVNGSTMGNEKPDNTYYITRNWLICNRKYMENRFTLFLCYFIINRLVWLLIWFMKNKRGNMAAVAEGIKDYKRGISGQYPKNSFVDSLLGLFA